MRHGCRGAKDNGGADAVSVARKIEGDGYIGKRPIEGILFALLEMRHAQAGRQCGQQDCGKDFMRLQIILPLQIMIRRDEEIFQQDVPGRTFGIPELEPCCACRKSNPNILVVQPAENWATTNVPG